MAAAACRRIKQLAVLDDPRLTDEKRPELKIYLEHQLKAGEGPDIVERHDGYGAGAGVWIQPQKGGSVHLCKHAGYGADKSVCPVERETTLTAAEWQALVKVAEKFDPLFRDYELSLRLVLRAHDALATD